MSHPQRHQETLSKGELRPEPKPAPSPTLHLAKTQAPSQHRQEASGFIVSLYRWLVTGRGYRPGPHTVPDCRSLTAMSWCFIAQSLLLCCFLCYRNCRWILALEHSGAKQEDIHHVEYCPLCYNLTSLAQMLSRKGNECCETLLFPQNIKQNKMKPQNLQLQGSFFQFPRQTAEESLVLVRTQNLFISSWIFSFTYLNRWLGLLVSYCLCPCLVSPRQ